MWKPISILFAFLSLVTDARATPPIRAERDSARLNISAGIGVAGSSDGPLVHAGGQVRFDLKQFVIAAEAGVFGPLMTYDSWDAAGLIGFSLHATKGFRLAATAALGARSLSVDEGDTLAFAYTSPFAGLRLGGEWSFPAEKRPVEMTVSLQMFANIDLNAASTYVITGESCEFGGDCRPVSRVARNGGGFMIGFLARIGVDLGL